MLYYKQPYRRQPIFYLLSILLALLGGIIFMSCDTRPQCTSINEAIIYGINENRLYGGPQNIEPPSLEAYISKVERTVPHVEPPQQLPVVIRSSDSPKQRIPIDNEVMIEWQCNNCTFRNPISTNLCEICGTSRIINADQEWICKACTFINPSSEKTCEACSSEIHNPIEYEPIEPIVVTTIPQKRKKKRECPICLEEENFKQQGHHHCDQCDKAICEPCYQSILKTNNKSCPLCRYEKY